MITPHIIVEQTNKLVSRIMYLYSFGIQSIEQIKSFDPKFQKNMVYIHPPKKLISDIKEMREEYSLWIIKNCLCEMNEIFLNNLDKMREFSLLFENFPPIKELSTYELKINIEKEKNWKRRKLMDKLKELKKYY